jgi:hypothetical protein
VSPIRIDELVEADAANVPVALDLLRSFDPAAVQMFELAGELFEMFNACAAASLSELDAAADRELVTVAANLGLTRDELIAEIRSDSARAEVGRARTLWKAIGGRHAKRFLLLLLSRYFRWGGAELLRLRVTSVLGYGRLQAEACGLLRLFIDEPDRAEEWQRATLSEGGGRRFYSQTQGTLRTIMTRYGLNAFYERGSGSSQHVRMTSAVLGLSITDMGTQLRDQEIDPEDPGSYFRAALWFLSAQVAVFASLGDCVPEVRCDRWAAAHEDFGRRWAALWRLLEERYPDHPREDGGGE